MAQPLTSALPFREVGLIVLCACALYMLLAIVSYSPMDPAWSFAGTDLVVTNLVGRSGAWAADVILFVFGWVAYALPIALFVTAIRLVRARHAQGQGSWLLFGIRVSGWVAMTVGICILARLHISAPGTLPAGAGGAVGDFLVQGGLPILNWIGLTLIALAMLLAGSQFALGYAWAHITETTGRTIYRCATSAVVAFERLFDRIGRYRRRRPTARVKRKRPATDSTNGQTRKSLPIVKKTTTPSPSPRVRQQRLFDLKTPAELPDLNLLDDVPGGQIPGFAKESLEAMSRMLELKLKDFGIEAEVVSVLPGPVITRFELQPAPGVKV
ncbi:MAG: DNA translocase FtsK 4TM domain-containing protein, partial [Gammaproteobacteria bacterium]|nr:DNA translocase FtsK 4TM domain-containing protein [Gammaproteobacteria bacterium]